MEISSLETLAEYGYKTDPFSVTMETADYVRMKRLIGLALASDRYKFLSITGERGIGKSVTVGNVLKCLGDIHLVETLSSAKERILIEDIERSMILELSNERPRHRKDLRVVQFRHTIGKASESKPIVLILEEAHRMHGQTLRSLKSTLENTKWKGRANLFTVILIGHGNALGRDGMSEIRLRADSAQMVGLSTEEIKQYIKATIGEHFENGAINAISSLRDARNYLDLQSILLGFMGRALGYGRRVVTEVDVIDTCGIKPNIKDMLEKVGISQSELAKRLDLSKTLTNKVINDKQGDIPKRTFEEGKGQIMGFLAEELRKIDGNKIDGNTELLEKAS
ncbi:MAG: ATP-binding protein [Nitrospirae bacterium]|nr:ATP-binding protein [Nitrospirota bacterium]